MTVSPEAEILFRVLYRFTNYKHGRPSYPEPITWSLIARYLDEKALFQSNRRYRLHLVEVKPVLRAVRNELERQLKAEKGPFLRGPDRGGN